MCKECGAGPGRCIEVGHDDRDRTLRLRRCDTCGTRYTTVEIALPADASFYVLADSWRYRQLLKARLRRGYHDTQQGRYRRSRRQRLDVRVRVIRGRWQGNVA